MDDATKQDEASKGKGQHDDPVTSRSADPGQSSYGGFSNEGPSVQNDHEGQDDELAGPVASDPRSEKEKQGAEGDTVPGVE